VLVTGPNGAGKTNLLESLHVGTQGFSPRTRADAQLVRFGRDAARVALRGDRAGVPVELEVTLELGSGKRAAVNGARLRAAEQLRSEVATLVFTPDRLVVVKGGPGARRAYFDRVLGRLSPARSGLSAEYGAAVGQRNAALRRVSQRLSSREALAPWNEQVSRLGAELVEGRTEAVELLRPRFRERAGELGLAAAELAYEGTAPTAATWSAARPGSARTWTMSASSPASATCARSARRANSGWPCLPFCSARQSCWRNAAACGHCCCWTTCSPSSIPSGGASWPTGSGPAGRLS